MGSIEVMNPGQRKPIFARSNTEGRPASKSPRTTAKLHQETIQRDNRAYSARSQSYLEQTNRVDRTPYDPSGIGTRGRIVRNQQQQTDATSRNNARGNPGNRVSNFNDFMIQLKRQLNSNSAEGQQNLTEFQQTLRNGEETREILRHSSSRQLVMNLKLQNQRLQLQKYKRLVERELSKNHSIEDISLKSKGENEQVLTIRYDECREKDFRKRNERGEDGLAKFREENGQQLAQKIAQQKRLCKSSYQRAREIFAELSGRTDRLELLIQRAEMPFKQQIPFSQISPSPVFSHEIGTITKNVKWEPSSYQGESELHPSQERISKISSLFEEIDHMHSNQAVLQQKIKAAITMNDDSQSDYSGTFSIRSQARQRC